jgi:hypothetical protein
MEETPTTSGEMAGDPAPRARLSPLLFWVIVAIPVIALILAFPIVSSTPFKKYCDYELLSVQTSLHEASHRPCDVLLFGDSTAETGLDPTIVAAQTGLTTCNIATTRPTFEILGQEPLDHYLARNPRPRFLVLQYSAGNFHPFEPDRMDPYHIDGVILAIRYYEWTKAVRVMARFPDYIIGLLNYTYFQGGKHMVSAMLGRKRSNKIQPNDNYFAFNKPPLTHCVPISDEIAPPDPSWVGTLRRQYSPYADHVLINVSPTSSCNSLYSDWKAKLGGLVDSGPELLPNDLFIDNFYHLSRPGTELLSKEVASQITALQHPQPAPKEAELPHGKL